MATAYSTSSVPARRSIMEIEWTGVAMQVPMSGDHLGACLLFFSFAAVGSESSPAAARIVNPVKPVQYGGRLVEQHQVHDGPPFPTQPTNRRGRGRRCHANHAAQAARDA
jgi:hypothetical protein